jgi:hypothetical protein
MDIRSEKLKAIEKLLKTQDEELIDKINSLLNEALLKPMTVEELGEKLNKSEKDIKEGRIHTHEQVISYFKKKSE